MEILIPRRLILKYLAFTVVKLIPDIRMQNNFSIKRQYRARVFSSRVREDMGGLVALCTAALLLAVITQPIAAGKYSRLVSYQGEIVVRW